MMLHVIASGAPGCAFVAFPRFGKTRAITYSRQCLPQAFPTYPIFTFLARHEKQTQAKFFTELLTQGGYIPSRKDGDLREQLVRAWWIQAQACGASRLIFFGDEMQELSENEFGWLIDVSNDLEQRGVRMTSILFGQPLLRGRRGGFVATERGDILGRFMSRWFAFEGISSARELRDVLDCYDDPVQQEYPQGSGYCYTRFFLPQAFEHGWRLASCAGLCWELFEDQARKKLELAVSTKISVGMEWVAGAVQYALTHYADYDRPQFSISRKEWQVAIDSTGFEESLGLTYHPQWAKRLRRESNEP